MAAYASVAELRIRLAIADAADDDTLAAALDAAERAVDAWCGRRFALEASATARQFRAVDPYCLDLTVSPIGSLTGLVVRTDKDADGVFENTLAASEYHLEPFDGVGPDGRTGWPWTLIRVHDDRLPIHSYGEPGVQVTARWGWPATPEPVKAATLLLAAETWKLKDATFGIAGFGEFGSLAVRDNPKIAALLAPYRHGASIVGIA